MQRIFVLFVLSAAGWSSLQGADYARVIVALRGQFSSAVASGATPGVAVAVVNDGSVVWAEGFGLAAAGGGERFTPGTLSSLQSISKHYTSLAFMRLAERGIVSLDTPIAAVLPEFQVNGRWPDTDPGAITFRQLLSHWSGLAHEAPVGNNFAPASPSLEAHVRSIFETWLRFRPGERFAYSNLGVDVAGYALERITGKPFAQVLREEVFAPLGMESSTFDYSDTLNAASLAKGHVDGMPSHVPIPMIPSGAMYSTVLDMSKCLAMHLARGVIDGTPFLRSESLAEIYGPQFGAPLQSSGYGLGTGVSLWRGGASSYGHSGGGFGYSAIQTWVPAHGLGIAILANSPDANTAGLSAATLEAFLREKLGYLPAWTRPPEVDLPVIPLPAGLLDRLTGTYKGRWGVLSLARNGTSLVATTTGVVIPLNAHSETLFSSPNNDGPVILQFRLDESGNAISATQPGDETWFVNDRPGEPAGPDLPEWARYEGRYAQGYASYRIERRNGYLYALQGTDPVKLAEYRPGLFFTPDGHSFLFDGDRAIIEGVICARVSEPVSGQAHRASAGSQREISRAASGPGHDQTRRSQ